MKTAIPLLCAVVSAFAVSPARACGVCDEDKVAATYDHTIVQRAASKGRVVVYCAVRGPLDAKRLRLAARQVKGLDLGTLRTSQQPAAVSFALDGAGQTPQAAVSALQANLPQGTELAIVGLNGAPSK